MTTENHSTTAPDGPTQYTHHRDFTGQAARFRILDAKGQSVLNIYFWDDPDTTEAADAETKAKMLVAAMNLSGGGQVEMPNIVSVLDERKQIADFWTIDHVRRVRPDLIEYQAWEVLQDVIYHYDRDSGITWNLLRATADKLFPASSQLMLKQPPAEIGSNPSADYYIEF